MRELSVAEQRYQAVLAVQWVSTFGDGVYDPHTYTTTFTVTPGS
ncbi:hypothetical protein [Mycobacterium sp. E2989]|nr:hypothetical protein [Mycobacterium sp. E2989]